jgi:flagellar hook assembly protein FlgD
VGVEEMKKSNITKEFDIIVYPNPTRGIAFISCKLLENTLAECALYDIRGAEVKKFFISQKCNNSTFIWDGRDNKGNRVGPGVYFLHVKTQNESSDAKIIVIE